MSTIIASAKNDSVTVTSYYGGVQLGGICYQVTWSNERGIQHLSFDDENNAMNFYNLILRSVEVSSNR